MGSNITKTKEIYLYIDRKIIALPKNGWLHYVIYVIKLL